MLLKVTEAAKVLGVSLETMRRKIRAGEWPFYQLGPKTTRIDPEEIKAIGRLVADAKQREKAS